MADITKTGPQPIKPATSNAAVVSGTFSKRNAIDLLPGVNQTETLQKFFDATVNHLIQPEDVEFLSGYIGSKPPYYNPSSDFYISEVDSNRQNYQLPVTALSVDTASNAVNNVMFYDDLLNQLNLQGANINNPSRLLENDYYSWSPPIDIDKFINYYEYYWLPSGPAVIELISETDLVNDVIGKTTFTYDGYYKRTGDDVELIGNLKFTSGMRIKVLNDVNYKLNGQILVVEGVGRSIKIQPDAIFRNPAWDTVGWNIRGWDGDDNMAIPDYMTIGRLSINGNRWSTYNRWFHKDTIEQSGLRILDLIATKAQRPIIEFNPDIQLYNFGTYGRPEVDLIDTIQKDIFAYLVGKDPAAVEIDGTPLIDGMRILVTADIDSTVNNRIYEVGGIFEYNAITLTLVTDGQNTTGAPAYGDSVHSYFGKVNGNKTYWYNGNSWVLAQQLIKYQPPIFAGYDYEGNRLNDPAIYPGSTFNGNTIFTYAIDTNNPVDSILQLQIKRDQFGDYVFNNSSVTSNYTYISNGQSTNIYGYVWYLDNNVLGNSWYKCKNTSRQYILNSYDITIDTATFLIDQTPAQQINGELPSVEVYLIQNGREKKLVKGLEYTNSSRIITLLTPAPAGSRVEIRSWSNNLASAKSGFYLLPLNLVANPNNDQPTTVSFNQTFDQFSDLISNQTNELTTGFGNTSWRDSAQVRGLGLHILQHRSPILKLMMLNSSNINTGILNSISLTDPSLAIQFAQKEYLKFYNKFIRTLLNLYKSYGYDNTTSTEEWINAALAQVNLGKSKASAWAYSGYEQNADFSVTTVKPTFIPPTSARLGVAPIFKPEVYLNDDYYPAKLTIQTHDGARIVMEELDGTPLGTIQQSLTHTSNPELLTHPVAGAWLQFELNIYNSIPFEYKNPDAELAFDLRIYRPGKWRSTEYSREEYLNILRPSFDKWTINTQVDYTANVIFNQNNQFSFNYGTCVDKDGQPVPGHWRGIYRYFYDTDRPHTHPWEMLGFSQKPEWWISEYGSTPYTRGNSHLWEDLRDGIIRQGKRAGQHSEWSRPGLMNCIPVDDQGELLPPILSGTIVSLPSFIDSQASWKFGDEAPVEHTWMTAIDAGYVVALASYLMKPARFIEQGWDPLRIVRVSSDDNEQSLYINTNRRRSSSEFFVHRENPSAISTTTNIPNETSLTFFGSWGIQHWISEYLISQNLSVTTYMGNIIRGAYGVLAHKFGGFVNSDNSLRVLVDSFGQIGYTSQLIPSENIQTYIYKSTSIGIYFYSGVIVVKQRNGWKVYGYDGIKQNFPIISSIQTGPKTTSVIGNINVTEYQTGQGISYVPYGTVFETRQDVYDFLISYGRFLENEGWIFDSINENNSKVINWKQSARDFIYWSQGNWDNGNFIALSPAANGAKFKKEFGVIQYVNGTIGGTYPVLDKSGQPIENQNLEVLRQGDEILVKTVNDQTVFGLRLFVTSIEHIMLLDNETQFGDLIYNSLYNIYQPRVKVYGYKTNQWTGRLDAPGYFLYQDPTTSQWTMIGNFDKTVEDFRNLYNIDQPKNILKIDNSNGEIIESSTINHAVARSDLASLAKHLIGYQPRQYLENLLLDQTTQFEFYQGFIKQKGTQRSLNNMLRTTNILAEEQNINYYEEFAFRLGRYGAISLNRNIDFIIPQNDVVNNPQRIDVFSKFNSDQKNDGVIQIVPRDSRIVVPPENYEGEIFPLRSDYSTSAFRDLPTAGYVQLAETDYWAVDQTALFNLSSTTALKSSDTVWQFIAEDGTWNIYKIVKPNSTVISTTPEVTETETSINFDAEHGIVAGDIVITYDFINNTTMNGTFTVSSVTSTSINIPISTFIEESSGTVLVYKSTRFYDIEDLQNSDMLSGWEEGDLAYVDNTDTMGLWRVYKRFQNQWMTYRKAELKVNANLMISSKLYSKSTLGTKAVLDYYDPVKGCIPGSAGREITYKNMFDPAQYNKGDEDIYNINPDLAWADSHVGEVWWDLSTTRYIDYEQGDLDYRAKNWGKLAPSTTITLYEWVRSPIPPTDWANYISTGNNLSQFGVDYKPSGTVRNSSNPVWTERTEYDSNGNSKTWYYFWVGNSDIKPTIEQRRFTTNELVNIIMNPSSNNLPWYAAISEHSVIVSNCVNYLNSNNTVMQIVYTNKANSDNDYKEWTLIRSGDPRSIIDNYFWKKLRDSLTGYDAMGNQVPDPNLNELSRYGTLIRPRQSWFKNRLAALAIWINRLNSQFASATIPLVEDTDKSDWITYFNQEEPVPTPDGNWDYAVTNMGELYAITRQLEDGDKIYVPPLAVNNNLWTIWTWDALNQEFILTRQQSYKVSNYWNYIDWYADGYNADIIPTYTVNTPNEAANIILSVGQTIKVLDYSSRGWALYGLVNGAKEIVGLQDGTIEISSSLYNSNINLDGFDVVSFDSKPFDYNPTIEIGIIFDGVKNAIYGSSGSIELNQLFFAMINYIFNEQGYVDWIFKTSYILVSGSNEPLSTSQLYKPNTVDNLLDYINETKPYRTKIREFISGRSIKDTANIVSTDFDKPVYNGRILNPDVVSDANILSSDSTYSPWYNNYKINSNLIRKIKTQLVFDRVASMPLVAEVINANSFGNTVRFDVTNNSASTFKIGEIVSVSNVVNQGNTFASFTSNDVTITYASGNVLIGSYTGNIGVGTGLGGAVFHQTYGAADRIIKSYAPTSYMPGKYSPDLISGTDFKGTVYTGLDFNLQPGWGVAPWDFAAGWDAGTTDFDKYLDLILEGGLPPVYETFYGDGQRTQFRLAKIPQDLQHTTIWKDGVVAVYGVDYIVPNWATRVEIADAGTGYVVGEKVELIPNVATPDNTNVIIEVTEVSLTGGITSAIVLNKGFFTTVQHEPYKTSYAPYQLGAGQGAVIQPVWGGDTLIFTVPPLESYYPNIWVLYAGATFDPAPEGSFDIITDGGDYIQPNIDPDHAEERYNAKVRDAIRMDTYSEPVGGMPVVMYKNYITDGLLDHFELGIRPQNTSATSVYLDGVMLVYGPLNDYVINFETAELVFVRPPAAGKVLIITTIGEGGTGNSVQAVQAVTPGINYSLGEVITLEGGSPVQNTSGVYDKATVQVTALTAVSVTVLAKGKSYKSGDILLLSNQSVESDMIVSRLSLKVEKVNSTGTIQQVSILSAGYYKQLPSSINWITAGKGIGAIISVNWGVCEASVVTQGLYSRKPTGPFTGTSVGTGATFNARYTSIIDQQTHISNGVSNTFNLKYPIINPDFLMVTCNGVVIPSSSIIINEKSITIPIQDEGVYVVITQFNTQQYSVVAESDIYVTVDGVGNIINTYSLPKIPYSSVPSYNTVRVKINGIPVNPPNVTTAIGNGFTRQFDLSFEPSSPNIVEVYIDGMKKIIGTDYTIVDKEVRLINAPVEGAVIVTVVPDPSSSYVYTINSTANTITFNGAIEEGYKITIGTYSQDLSYQFTTETFSGNPNRLYKLSGIPSPDSSFLVSVNGIAYKLLWDYSIVVKDSNGYDINPYDIDRYDLGLDNQYFVVFNDNINQSVNDIVVVQYMRGRSERPATAFRNFISSTNYNISQVLSNDSRTILLNNVYVNTSQIEVADITALTAPTLKSPGYVWVDNELIEFSELRPVPSAQYPNKGILSNILRGVGGTSSSPAIEYDTDFWDGNNNTIYYPSSSSTAILGETVKVDGKAQVGGIVNWYTLTNTTTNVPAGGVILSANSIRVYLYNAGNYKQLVQNNDYFIQASDQILLAKTYPNGTVIKIELDSDVNVRSNYYIGNNPIGQPAGRYVVFDELSIPGIGDKNIVISRQLESNGICHLAGSLVQDAGSKVIIPGGYNWELAPQGLQYNTSDMAKFIIDHPGTIS